MADKTITLPWPAKELHSNFRGNRFAKSRATKEARNTAWAISMESPRVECMPNARLLFEYYPPHRRYDAQNIPHSLKAYIDGIADAMGCDDRGFEVDYPSVWAGSGKPGKIVVHIRAPLTVDVEMRGKIS